MHEISLVQSLFQQVEDLAANHQATKILQITMRIGPLSGVVIDSFRFGFDIIAKDNTLMRNAELVIEETSVTYRCTNCWSEMQSTGEKPDKCPQCGEIFLLAEGGDDLILQNVVME